MAFEVIYEVEPATRADLMRVRHQIGVMSRIASAFLIPDNHIGRATVSSIAVAHEVALMGGKLSVDIPQLAVSPRVVKLVERDPDPGVELAADLIGALRGSGAFDGVHLIPVGRYRQIAARLEGM